MKGIIMITALLLAAATPAPALKNDIKTFLEPRLLDAQSARYIWPKRHSQKTYCGFVNAKNRMGAYTGYRLFMTFTDPAKPIKVRIERDRDPNVVRIICEGAGYPVNAGDAQ